MSSTGTDGNTPLDPDEARGLIPTHITTMDELNEWEQANIIQAERWAFRRRHNEVLSVPFLLELHAKMFGDTWTWAGQTRTSGKTVGIQWWQISEALANLCKDVRYWLDSNVFAIDEAAARFHHRLTYIHAFPNGNGRHARLATDVFLVANRRPRFGWGLGDLRRVGDTRTNYINALRAADDQDFTRLLEFLELGARKQGPEMAS